MAHPGTTKPADPNSTEIEPLIQDWLRHVQENIAREEEVLKKDEPLGIPYMAVPASVVKVIFVLTGNFGLEPNTRYLSVHIFDKFMRNHFRNVYETEIKESANPELWQQIAQNIASQAKLRVMSCIQLASKMDSHTKYLGITQVMQSLQLLDNKLQYTRTAIFNSEMKVYKTIDFKIPVYTPLHSVEILLATTRLYKIPDTYEVCINLLDLAYLQHERLYSHFHHAIRGKFIETKKDRRSITVMQNNVLYLGAVVVLCSVFCLCMEESDAKRLVDELSDLVGIVEEDIWLMAKMLFDLALENDS